MSERKRGWFQIHLSTWLALMLATCLIGWANFGEKHVPDIAGHPLRVYGFPFIVDIEGRTMYYFAPAEWLCAIFDFIFALVVITLTVVAFEWWESQRCRAADDPA